MQIFVRLTSAATSTGPFMIYSNMDGYVYAYGVNISKAALLVGVTITVPNYTTSIKIRSNGKCTNNIIVTVPGSSPTTTSTTTSTSSTTSTTSSSTSTTSTTTSTTVCTRPTGLLQRYMLQSINLNSVWYNSTGQNYAYTCNLYSLIRDWGVPTSSGMLSCEFASLTVGQKVYETLNSPLCNVVPNGSYIYTNTNFGDPVGYCLANNPVQIVTIVAGIITAITPCYDDNLIVTNNTLTGTIDNIFPISYTPSTGSFPIASASSFTGVHTGFSGDISVNITDATVGNNISIYRAGVFLYCLDTSGTGVYTFPTFTWTSAQELRIVYSIGNCL